MSEFLMPSLGADMESAILMEWLVKEGDSVSKGQVIAEIETSKGVIEIEVFEDGIVEKLLAEEESKCEVGMPLAIIGSGTKESIEIEEKVAREEKDPKSRIQISPAARKKAIQLGIDITKIVPIDGFIQLSQVESLSSKTKVPDKPKPEESTERRETTKVKSNNSMRQAIAAAMIRSNSEIPHYYLSTSINMTAALDYLEGLNNNRTIKDRILPVAMMIRAVVLALKEVPDLNGFWVDDAHHINREVHPGMAISLRRGGLMTPALLNAESMSLSETMDSLSDLITRTRTGKLRSSEMTKQTITITNLGDLGVESVYGVIYPPQLAVIGFGAILDTPWAMGDTLSVRRVLKATLAADHRATDGRVGAKFLDKLNQLLQNPEELL